MSDPVSSVEAAVKSAASSAVASAESKVVAFVRANALKAIGIAAAVGFVAGHLA